MPSKWLVLLLSLGSSVPVAAQDFYFDASRIEAVLDRFESGDASVRPALELLGRNLMVWATQRRVVGPQAHLVARVGFSLGKPLAYPDSAISARERLWRPAAVRALRSALAADSGDITAALMLERLEPYPHVWLEPHRELAHLRALATRHRELPAELTRALLGLALERDLPELAVTAFHSIARDSIVPSEWYHLAAQVAFANGDSAAAELYFRGAAMITDSVSANVYRADLQWISEPEELSEWDALSQQTISHESWLRAFWTRKDLEDARIPGTRLQEHFRRWRLALRNYRWDLLGSHAIGSVTRAGMAEELNHGDIAFPMPRLTMPAPLLYHNRSVSLSRVLDDRGALIMRHGPPSAEAVMPGVTHLAQEMMRWDTRDGPLVVAFSRAPSDMSSGDLKFGMVARNRPVGDLIAGCQLDSALCSLAALASMASASPDVHSERTRVRYTETRQLAESTEGNPERFGKSLNAITQVYGIPGGGVLVVYAVPAQLLGDTGIVAARVRAIIGDVDAGKIVTAVDTLRQWNLDSPLPDDAFVSGWLVAPAPVGTWQVATVLSDSSRTLGSGTTFRAVPVINRADSQLQLGDLILGREGSGLSWGYRGSNVPLNPTGAWHPNQPVVMTVEANGLILGRQYHLALEIWSIDPDALAPRLAVASEIQVNGASSLLQRNISFEQLGRGTYRLVVRLTDATSGAEAVRERLVSVK